MNGLDPEILIYFDIEFYESLIKVSFISSVGILASDRGPPIHQLNFSPRPCEETVKEVDQEKGARDEEETVVTAIPTPPRSFSQENEIKVRSLI